MLPHSGQKRSNPSEDFMLQRKPERLSYLTTQKAKRAESNCRHTSLTFQTLRKHHTFLLPRSPKINTTKDSWSSNKHLSPKNNTSIFKSSEHILQLRNGTALRGHDGMQQSKENQCIRFDEIMSKIRNVEDTIHLREAERVLEKNPNKTWPVSLPPAYPHTFST